MPPIDTLEAAWQGMKLRVVNVSDLYTDEYQREVKAKRVRRIARSFDPIKAGVILVSERGGIKYLIDGNHRVSAMKTIDVAECPAIVLQGLTREQEAEYFRRQNENTGKLSHYDLFKAGLVAKDAECLEIQQIVVKNEFRLSSSSKESNRITAIHSLIRIYRQYGAATLDKTLTLIRQTWGDGRDMTKTEYLLGIAEFIKRFGMIDFAERFGDIPFASIYQRYQMLREGMTNKRAFCMALTQRYNDTIHNPKKRLVMDYED
jgi:hypothetical protein